MAVNTASLVYALWGLFLIPGILCRLGLKNPRLLPMALFLVTPLSFYSVRAGSMSHAVSFFINTVFLDQWLRFHQNPPKNTLC